MRLYFHPMTRATRPRWLLEELGAPYELEIVDVYKGEGKRPEYLETHPHGAVPALTDGDLTLIESSAICLYLADQHAAGGLAPPLGSAERGRYYQWMIYSVATAEPPVLKVLRHTQREPNPALADEGRAQWEPVARFIDRSLGDRPFILGERFSAADVMLGSVVALAERLKLNESFPRLQAYAKRLTARPAFQKSRAAT